MFICISHQTLDGVFQTERQNGRRVSIYFVEMWSPVKHMHSAIVIFNWAFKLVLDKWMNNFGIKLAMEVLKMFEYFKDTEVF